MDSNLEKGKNALAASVSDKLKVALSKFPEQERQNVLLNTATWYSIYYNLEQIYYRIFGGQILLLKQMQNSENAFDEQDIKSYFRSYLGGKKIRGVDVQPWVDFLITNELIKPISAGKYILSDKGIVFVDYAFSNNHDGKVGEI